MAWASMAVPAWVRIWLRVKVTISSAMSVSRIRLSEAERFSVATCRLAMRGLEAVLDGTEGRRGSSRPS